MACIEEKLAGHAHGPFSNPRLRQYVFFVVWRAAMRSNLSCHRKACVFVSISQNIEMNIITVLTTEVAINRFAVPNIRVSWMRQKPHVSDQCTLTNLGVV